MLGARCLRRDPFIVNAGRELVESTEELGGGRHFIERVSAASYDATKFVGSLWYLVKRNLAFSALTKVSSPPLHGDTWQPVACVCRAADKRHPAADRLVAARSGPDECLGQTALKVTPAWLPRQVLPDPARPTIEGAQPGRWDKTYERNLGQSADDTRPEPYQSS